MTGRHSVSRRWVRIGITMAAAGAATAGVLAAAAAPSSAAASSTSCRARSIAFDGPRPFVIGAANNQLTPCATDYTAITDTTVPVLGVNPLVTIGVHAVNNGTFYNLAGAEPEVTSASATSDIALVTINGLGLNVRIEGVHSQANAEASQLGEENCINNTSSSSYVAKVTVNGKQIKILDSSTPITIKLPLRLSLSLNRQVVSNHQVTQDVIYLQWPDKRYDIAIGETTAGTNC
jgi:hypothetical protein